MSSIVLVFVDIAELIEEVSGLHIAHVVALHQIPAKNVFRRHSKYVKTIRRTSVIRDFRGLVLPPRGPREFRNRALPTFFEETNFLGARCLISSLSSIGTLGQLGWWIFQFRFVPRRKRYGWSRSPLLNIDLRLFLFVQNYTTIMIIGASFVDVTILRT